MIAALPRLQDRLGSSGGAVSYVVRGGQDQFQRPLLELEITSSIRLQCDRCLAPLDYELALQSRVLLSHPGEVQQDDDDPEALEWIEAGQELDLQELVEDEILLGLPLAVRHDPENCSSGKSAAAPKNVVDRPFANLVTLLEPRHTKKQKR